MVGFASERFIGSESLGFIEVVVELNGTSNSPITVIVSPMVQSPTSAATSEILAISTS